jgi:t-SNARE complex subunit (syntaxin)
MSDAEFFAKIMPKRLTSLAEDFKKSQDEFRQDEKNRELRRSGKLPTPEITREQLPGDVVHKQDLSILLRSGQVIPASALAKQKEDAEKLAKDLEEAVRSEISHRRTKIQTEPDKTVAHYTREPFEE